MLPGNNEKKPLGKGGRTLPPSSSKKDPLKTSVCEWDLPSSSTGTVRRKNTKNKMSSSLPKKKLSPIAGTSGTQPSVKLNLHSNSNQQISEIFTDIPESMNKKTPPPYKEPPTPPPLSQIPSLGMGKIPKLKQNNPPSGKVVFGKKERREMNTAGGAIKNCISKLTGSPSKSNKEKEEKNIQAKLQNIPVRPRKTSTISKEENYCLFDPSVDFINEKKQTKVDVHPPTRDEDDSQTTTSPDTSEDIVEEIIYEDSQEIENKDYHNYFIIDPEDMLSENDEEIKVEMVDVVEKDVMLPLVEQRRKLKFLNLSSPMHQNNNSSSSASSNSTSTSSSSTSSSSSASLAVGGGVGSSSFITYKLDKDKRNRTIPLVAYGSPYAVNRTVQYKKSSKRPQSVHSDADSGFLSPCTPEDFKFNAEILALEEWNNLQVYVEVGRKFCFCVSLASVSNEDVLMAFALLGYSFYVDGRVFAFTRV